MKNVSCEIIQDILPLYHDHVCSAASSAMVDHLSAFCLSGIIYSDFSGASTDFF